MNKNTLSYARSLDSADPLAQLRNEFLFPEQYGKPYIYLCGNSLGLQPKKTKDVLLKQLSNWGSLGVEGWFAGEEPWMFYHKAVKELMAPLVGASAAEVCPMNTLTVNLHLLLVSFYKPTAKKYKIIMEAGAFPSDQYALESQVRFHNFDPADAIIEIAPKDGAYTLETADIIEAIQTHGDEVALVLFSGINYFTGQWYDMEKITQAGHAIGAMIGFDLAHAAGNVPMKLHDWDVDFACWCSYKYQNAGPGGISGIFVHEKHFNDPTLDRFAGWWGYQENTRFKMEKGFKAEAGADGWQVSCTQVMPLAMYYPALQLFQQAGNMESLRRKSIALTNYLQLLINEVNIKLGEQLFTIITPQDENARGAQLSIIANRNAREIFDGLVEKNVLGDWREPNVIRLSPVPLYNSFEDVFITGQVLLEVTQSLIHD